MSLTIAINSFSYKQDIPNDSSGNGGGFVFDCRGIENPGRQDAYKRYSGLDRPVIDFLENMTTMPEFIDYVINLLSLSIDNYLERGFENLQVNFGCTGGQHRSVYSAEQTAKLLREKYPDIKVKIRHTNYKNWRV